MEFGIVRLIGIFVFGKLIFRQYDKHLKIYLFLSWQSSFSRCRSLGCIAASADVGFAIYGRYAAEALAPSVLGPGGGVGMAVGMGDPLVGPLLVSRPVSYVAHLTGALAGLTIGLLVLKNFEQKLHEQLLWWVSLGVYAACTMFAVLFNVLNGAQPSFSLPHS